MSAIYDEDRSLADALQDFGDRGFWIRSVRLQAAQLFVFDGIADASGEPLPSNFLRRGATKIPSH